MLINKITQTPVGTDYANLQLNPAIRIRGSIVMLSRSEASPRPTRQTLRFAQGDKRGAAFKIPPIF